MQQYKVLVLFFVLEFYWYTVIEKIGLSRQTSPVTALSSSSAMFCNVRIVLLFLEKMLLNLLFCITAAITAVQIRFAKNTEQKLKS